MATYLLDTNVLLRYLDLDSAAHASAAAAIEGLLGDEHELYITAQNLVELWAVGTRPVDQNGLGWSPRATETVLHRILERFGFLEETPQVFKEWRQLVSHYEVRGKQVHDARLVAVMVAHGVHRLVTFNADDFRRYSEISVLQLGVIR